MNRKKITSKAENKRIGHKKARAAERQVLEGGYHRSVQGLSWSSHVEQPHIPDIDRPQTTRPRKKNKRKWCKGKVGVEHVLGFRKFSPYVDWSVATCARCGKRLWGYKPPTPQPIPVWTDHWATANIQRRLAGLECHCGKCKGYSFRGDNYP